MKRFVQVTDTHFLDNLTGNIIDIQQLLREANAMSWMLEKEHEARRRNVVEAAPAVVSTEIVAELGY